jgi:cell division protein FtsB
MTSGGPVPPGGRPPGDPPFGGTTRPPNPPSPSAQRGPGRLSASASAAHAAALVAAARQTRLTGRAALLAVVICAIALSLAYPVREYIAQRQQIDQLLAQQQTMSAQVKALSEQNTQLSQVPYIEQQAEDQLHMCFPNEQCYEVISGQSAHAVTAKPQAPADPWYNKLWHSVQQANSEPAR